MKPSEQDIKRALDERTQLFARLDGDIATTVAEMGRTISECLRGGGTVFTCGNGGSATQAQHFAGELVGRFKMDRRSLPAYSLSDNMAAVTSVANDYGYTDLFARQIEGMARPGDCLLALSTSGNSPNVVKACEVAREKEVRVLSMTGEGGGKVAAHSDLSVRVPHTDTPLIQEAHLIVIHLICHIVETALFP